MPNSKCRFCGKPLAEGFKSPKRTTIGHVYVCFECGDFILQLVGDNMPSLMREAMNAAEKELTEEVKLWNIEEELKAAS